MHRLAGGPCDPWSPDDTKMFTPAMAAAWMTVSACCIEPVAMQASPSYAHTSSGP